MTAQPTKTRHGTGDDRRRPQQQGRSHTQWTRLGGRRSSWQCGKGIDCSARHTRRRPHFAERSSHTRGDAARFWICMAGIALLSTQQRRRWQKVAAAAIRMDFHGVDALIDSGLREDCVHCSARHNKGAADDGRRTNESYAQKLKKVDCTAMRIHSQEL